MNTNDLRFRLRKKLGVSCTNILILRRTIILIKDVYFASMNASKAVERVNQFKMLFTFYYKENSYFICNHYSKLVL